MKILVVGDLHGEFGRLNHFVNKRQPDLILACGDFGYWPRMVGKPIRTTYTHRIIFDQGLAQLKNKKGDGSPIPIHFADGNHEDHESLLNLLDQADPLARVEVAPHVYWQPRGSTLTLPDGRIVCFLGGAKSTDQEHRTQGEDWFPEEVLTEDVLDRLPGHADIVISHTQPRTFGLRRRGWDRWCIDLTEDVLEEALRILRPERWYFGHFHQSRQGESEGTRWHVLNMCPETGWWMWL